MFDNMRDLDSCDTEANLRRNLQRFNRDSLKILHPVFVDALRLLAHRHAPDKKDTLLLPLAQTRSYRQRAQTPKTIELFPLPGPGDLSRAAVRIGA